MMARPSMSSSPRPTMSSIARKPPPNVNSPSPPDARSAIRPLSFLRLRPCIRVPSSRARRSGRDLLFRSAAEILATGQVPLASKKDYAPQSRSEEHTSALQSQSNLVCRLLLVKKKNRRAPITLTRDDKVAKTEDDITM